MADKLPADIILQIAGDISDTKTKAQTVTALQQPIISFLNSKNASYKSFWINNTLLVRNVDAELFRQLSGRSDVVSIVLDANAAVILK